MVVKAVFLPLRPGGTSRQASAIGMVVGWSCRMSWGYLPLGSQPVSALSTNSRYELPRNSHII